MLLRPSQDRPYYVPLHSALPLCVLILLFAGFLFVAIIVIVVAFFAIPSTQLVESADFAPVPGPDNCLLFPEFNASALPPCNITLHFPTDPQRNLLSLNGYALFFFSFQIRLASETSSIIPPVDAISFPIRFDEVSIESYNAADGSWSVVTNEPWRDLEREVSCFVDSADADRRLFCAPVLVFHEVYIRSIRYRLTMQIRRPTVNDTSEDVERESFDRSIFENRGTWVVVMGNPAFALVQVGYRSFFAVVGIVALIAFTVIVCLKQGWRASSVEQKMVIVLLITLLFLNNPLSALKYAGLNYYVDLVFSMLRIILKMLFFATFLFVMLVLAHSLYAERKEKKTFVGFYATKLAVCGGIFAVATVTMCYASMHQGEGAVSYLKSSIYFFPMLRWGAGILFVAYVGILLYYVARSCSKCALICKKSRNMCVIYSATIMQVFVAVVVYFVLSQLPISTGVYSVTFSYLFNGYVLILAILFTPSWKLDESIPEVAFSRLQTEDDDIDGHL